MPNTFGTSARQVKLVNHADAVRALRRRFRRPNVPQLDLANSLYVPCGRLPARSWILLTRADYDLVRGYGLAFQLTFQAYEGADSLTFSNLAIVQARCVTSGVPDNPGAIYLVELTDQRGLLANEWFQVPANVYYNVLAPAYPTLYYASSLNAGVAWTWSTMVGDLWDRCGFLGTYTGLPSMPSGTPTNWNLPGVPVWDSLCDALEHIGMSVACDLTQAKPYSVVSLGADDDAFDLLTTTHILRLEDDLEWIDTGAGRVPGTVVVYFRRVYQQYGTEETVRRDSNQWATASVYPVSVSAPAAFAGAVGIHGLHDDFPVRCDVNGVPLATDVTAAAAIAAERAQQYFDAIYSRTSGYMNRTYAGVLPFCAGSQVDGVCWRQDARAGRLGWRTQVLRGDVCENWPEVYKR